MTFLTRRPVACCPEAWIVRFAKIVGAPPPSPALVNVRRSIPMDVTGIMPLVFPLSTGSLVEICFSSIVYDDEDALLLVLLLDDINGDRSGERDTFT